MQPSEYKKVTHEDKWLKHLYTKSCKKRLYPYHKRYNRKKLRRYIKTLGED